MQVKINNKKYTVPELTFEHLTKMEEQGLSVIEAFQKRQYFLMAMAFTCVVVDVERDEAENLLTQHVYGGGSIQSIAAAFTEAVSKSDFFLRVLGIPAEKTKAETQNEQGAE